jgi:hypothetical protein
LDFRSTALLNSHPSQSATLTETHCVRRSLACQRAYKLTVEEITEAQLVAELTELLQEEEESGQPSYAASAEPAPRPQPLAAAGREHG